MKMRLLWRSNKLEFDKHLNSMGLEKALKAGEYQGSEKLRLASQWCYFALRCVVTHTISPLMSTVFHRSSVFYRPPLSSNILLIQFYANCVDLRKPKTNYYESMYMGVDRGGQEGAVVPLAGEIFCFDNPILQNQGLENSKKQFWQVCSIMKIFCRPLWR